MVFKNFSSIKGFYFKILYFGEFVGDNYLLNNELIYVHFCAEFFIQNVTYTASKFGLNKLNY